MYYLTNTVDKMGGESIMEDGLRHDIKSKNNLYEKSNISSLFCPSEKNQNVKCLWVQIFRTQLT